MSLFLESCLYSIELGFFSQITSRIQLFVRIVVCLDFSKMIKKLAFCNEDASFIVKVEPSVKLRNNNQIKDIHLDRK